MLRIIINIIDKEMKRLPKQGKKREKVMLLAMLNCFHIKWYDTKARRNQWSIIWEMLINWCKHKLEGGTHRFLIYSSAKLKIKTKD
jgi:hypothetical protein